MIIYKIIKFFLLLEKSIGLKYILNNFQSFEYNKILYKKNNGKNMLKYMIF